MQNDLEELWSLFHWLYPAIFTPATFDLFSAGWQPSHAQYSTSLIRDAEKLLSAVMLRRTKSAVDIDVPPREELTVFVPMSEAQRFWTYRLLTRLDSGALAAIFAADKENAGKENEDGGQGEGESLSAAAQASKAYIAAKVKESKSAQHNREWGYTLHCDGDSLIYP